MIDMSEFFDLLETGAIETYRGEVEVLTDRFRNVVVLSQGDRILVLSFQQARDLSKSINFKVGSEEKY